MEILKNEKIKYVIALVVGLALFFLGSLLYMYAVYAVNNINTGVSFEEYYDAIVKYKDPFGLSIMQFVSYIPFLLIILFVLKDDLKIDFYEFKKNWKKFLLYAVSGFGIVILTTLVVSLIYLSFGETGTSENENIITKVLLSNGAIPMIISVVILAPITEELLFRKIFFGFAEKTLNLKPWIAIVISSLVFAVIHVSDAENIKYIFQYLPVAVVMCTIYHYSNNNIYVAILIHMFNNAFAVITTYLKGLLGVEIGI